MVDAKRYPNAKRKGLVQITEQESELYLLYKRFDVRDGSESEPELQKIDLEELLLRKELLTKELEGLNELFSDLENFKNPID
jgi:hypothetical protein